MALTTETLYIEGVWQLILLVQEFKKNRKTYLCILSLLSLELVRVCNITLTSLSLYIVSWIIYYIDTLSVERE